MKMNYYQEEPYKKEKYHDNVNGMHSERHTQNRYNGDMVGDQDGGEEGTFGPPNAKSFADLMKEPSFIMTIVCFSMSVYILFLYLYRFLRSVRTKYRVQKATEERRKEARAYWRDQNRKAAAAVKREKHHVSGANTDIGGPFAINSSNNEHHQSDGEKEEPSFSSSSSDAENRDLNSAGDTRTNSKSPQRKESPQQQHEQNLLHHPDAMTVLKRQTRTMAALLERHWDSTRQLAAQVAGLRKSLSTAAASADGGQGGEKERQQQDMDAHLTASSSRQRRRSSLPPMAGSSNEGEGDSNLPTSHATATDEENGGCESASGAYSNVDLMKTAENSPAPQRHGEGKRSHDGASSCVHGNSGNTVGSRVRLGKMPLLEEKIAHYSTKYVYVDLETGWTTPKMTNDVFGYSSLTKAEQKVHAQEFRRIERKLVGARQERARLGQLGIGTPPLPRDEQKEMEQRSLRRGDRGGDEAISDQNKKGNRTSNGGEASVSHTKRTVSDEGKDGAGTSGPPLNPDEDNFLTRTLTPEEKSFWVENMDKVRSFQQRLRQEASTQWALRRELLQELERLQQDAGALSVHSGPAKNVEAAHVRIALDLNHPNPTVEAILCEHEKEGRQTGSLNQQRSADNRSRSDESYVCSTDVNR